MNRLKKYIEDVAKEWKVISWPSWEDLKGSTVVVLVFAVLLCIFLFVSDQSMNFLVQAILG